MDVVLKIFFSKWCGVNAGIVVEEKWLPRVSEEVVYYYDGKCTKHLKMISFPGVELDSLLFLIGVTLALALVGLMIQNSDLLLIMPP